MHLKAGRDPDINSLKRRNLRADFKRLPALLYLGHFFLNGTLDSHFSQAVTLHIALITKDSIALSVSRLTLLLS